VDPLNDTLSVGPTGCLTIEGIRVGSKGIVATKAADDAPGASEEKVCVGVRGRSHLSLNPPCPQPHPSRMHCCLWPSSLCRL
jgi:hypothetical protein